MFFLLIFFAFLSGTVSLIILWPLGPVFSLLSAPIIASLMTAVGAFLIRTPGYLGPVLGGEARPETDARSEVKTNE